MARALRKPSASRSLVRCNSGSRRIWPGRWRVSTRRPVRRSRTICRPTWPGCSRPSRLEDNVSETPMAMTMSGEIKLAASRESVWAKLNDPEVLKACIPGCEELEKTEDQGFRAVAKMKVGPVSARFKGRVALSDLDPPNGYRISGEGEGGVAGFAKGGATVGLAEKDGGTLLSYNVEAQIGGKLAQLGQRLINGAAKKLADEFFANFAKAVQG